MRSFPIPQPGTSARSYAARIRESLRSIFTIVGDGKNIAVSPSATGIKIRLIGGSVAFSGRAFVSGVLFADLNTDSAKPWVKIKASVPAASEEAGPAPSPFPADEEWYEKSKTAGDIHVPRF